MGRRRHRLRFGHRHPPQIGADGDHVRLAQNRARGFGAVNHQRRELALFLDLHDAINYLENHVLPRDRAVVEPDHAALGAAENGLSFEGAGFDRFPVL